jgi:hypothetical protein
MTRDIFTRKNRKKACTEKRALHCPVTCPAICVPIGRVDTRVDRPDPKDLSTFLVSAPSSCRTGDSSCPPDLEISAVTKWLGSRC